MIRHHVAFGVLVRDGAALLVHRRADRTLYPDVWDLPGGHVEAGEDPADTVRRELREEVGVEGGELVLLEIPVITAPDAKTEVYAVVGWAGEPHNSAPDEHDDLRWVREADVPTLSLAVPEIATLVRAAIALRPSERASDPAQ